MAGPFPYIEEDFEDYPAPGCAVVLSYDSHKADCTAILDSGAEFTSVPAALVGHFQLEQRGDIARWQM